MTGARVGAINVDRRWRWARALLITACAVLVAVAGIAPAMAVPTSAALTVARAPGVPQASTYDTAAYVYDAPALSSSQSAAATCVRGSPAGQVAVSWGTPVSTCGCCTAADAGAAGETEVAGSGLPELGARPNFANPAEAPGGSWEWRGTGEAGSGKGSWYNPNTGESLHPDLGHPEPIGPHYDWKAPDGNTYGVYPDGTVTPK